MMSFYFILTFVATLSALPSAKRDVGTILTNLRTIDTNTNALTAEIRSWDGSLLGALGIQSDVTTLQTSITSATTEAGTESQVSSADSTTILNFVDGTLSPDIVTALNALTAREADFSGLSLNSLVLSDLETLQSDTNALGAALIRIASADTQASASSAVASIDAAFESAIAVFS